MDVTEPTALFTSPLAMLVVCCAVMLSMEAGIGGSSEVYGGVCGACCDGGGMKVSCGDSSGTASHSCGNAFSSAFGRNEEC